MFAKNIRIVFLMAILLALPLEVAHLTGIPLHLYVGKTADFVQTVVHHEESHANVVVSSVKKAAGASAKHVHCVATAIYWEAANEPFLGQIAVARVIMNRVIHGFASNPCAVVYQTTTQTVGDQQLKVCQFSWHCEGKGQPRNSPTYQQALQIATEVLEENKWVELFPTNILFFHNHGVNPRWRYKREMTIGNHVFYSTGRDRRQPHQRDNQGI